MDRRHKALIEICKPYLLENLEPSTHFLAHLSSKRILTESMVEEIENPYTHSTREKKVAKFLKVLVTRGPEAYNTFLEALAHEQPWVKEYLEEQLEFIQKTIPALPAASALPPASAVAGNYYRMDVTAYTAHAPPGDVLLEKDLLRFAKVLGKRWKDFGRHLGINPETVVQPELDGKECAAKMLETWQKMEPLDDMDKLKQKLVFELQELERGDSARAVWNHTGDKSQLFASISGQITKIWKSIGIGLGVSHDQLEVIENACQGVGHQNPGLDMLIKWQRKGTGAKAELIDVAYKLGWTDLVNHLEGRPNPSHAAQPSDAPTPSTKVEPVAPSTEMKSLTLEPASPASSVSAQSVIPNTPVSAQPDVPNTSVSAQPDVPNTSVSAQPDVPNTSVSAQPDVPNMDLKSMTLESTHMASSVSAQSIVPNTSVSAQPDVPNMDLKSMTLESTHMATSVSAKPDVPNTELESMRLEATHIDTPDTTATGQDTTDAKIKYDAPLPPNTAGNNNNDDVDDPIYEMKQEMRVIIFNNCYSRPDSEYDVASLVDLFTSKIPRCSVIVWTDSPRTIQHQAGNVKCLRISNNTDVINAVKEEASKGDKYDALIMIPMGHAEGDTMEVGNGSTQIDISKDIIDNMCSPLEPKAESSLPKPKAGYHKKPKIFLIQACRGKNPADPVFDEPLPGPGMRIYRSATHKLADIMVADSTMPAEPSPRAPFISWVTSVFRDHWRRRHVAEMIRLVQIKVNKEFPISYKPEEGLSFSQLPIFQSTLLGRVYLGGSPPQQN